HAICPSGGGHAAVGVQQDPEAPDNQQPQEDQQDSDETPKEKPELKEKSSGGRKSSRFQPYSKDKHGDKKGVHRNRVFISNIPYDMKWQAIKDLMREKGNDECDKWNLHIGLGGGYSGMDGMGSMGGYAGRDMTPMSRMGDMYRSGIGGVDRDLGRNELPMNRGFGETFGGMVFAAGMGSAGIGPLRMGSMGMERMGPGIERMASGMDMNRGYRGYGGGSSHMGSGMSDRSSGSKAGCQIFVRNLSYDLTWQKLKEKFSHCGQVMFAEIKMENGKSKGCGTVRFDCPESAEQACRMMNGTKINGREVDVRIDRNA
uniref:Myelin expression factor 2 n=1 Tax=Paramormyrops kingsleyae TaxID=1676925 RepID=A0A3B3Q8G9_9TELE